LIESQPRLDGPLGFPLASIPGAPPVPAARPEGCAFHPRCALAHARCRASVPPLEEVRGAAGRRSACIEAERLLAARSPAP
jgi:oligopeptide/dipeptide ABC transporter ATP-binding protein